MLAPVLEMFLQLLVLLLLLLLFLIILLLLLLLLPCQLQRLLLLLLAASVPGRLSVGSAAAVRCCRGSASATSTITPSATNEVQNRRALFNCKYLWQCLNSRCHT